MQHVEGNNKGDVVLYALSTCGWCKRTRMLLEEMEVEYDYIYVDLLEGDERQEIIQQLKEWNPKLSFPTTVIRNEECIVGFNEDKIRENLE